MNHRQTAHPLLPRVLRLALFLFSLSGCSAHTEEEVRELQDYQARMERLAKETGDLCTAIQGIDLTDPSAPSLLLPKIEDLTMTISDAASAKPPQVCSAAHEWLMQSAREMTAARAALEETLGTGILERGTLEEAMASYDRSLENLSGFFSALQKLPEETEAGSADSSSSESPEE